MGSGSRVISSSVDINGNDRTLYSQGTLGYSIGNYTDVSKQHELTTIECPFKLKENRVTHSPATVFMPRNKKTRNLYICGQQTINLGRALPLIPNGLLLLGLEGVIWRSNRP